MCMVCGFCCAELFFQPNYSCLCEFSFDCLQKIIIAGLLTVDARSQKKDVRRVIGFHLQTSCMLFGSNFTCP